MKVAILVIFMLERIVNPNLTFLHDQYHAKKSGVVQEGSSRSGKTWSDVDFLVYLCSTIETSATINIIKETRVSFKTTLYDDFNRRLPMFGISSPFSDRQEVSNFKLFGNKINLLGADSDSVYHGVSCDYFWVNEALDVSQQVFDQSEQRCRKFWWMDYNPKVTEHWVYDRVCKRSDVGFLKTTLFDNPHISNMEKRKILGYEPTHPDDRDLPQKQRRVHPTNINDGTADDYMWNVYGLGLRSAPEGLIFQHVNWLTADEYPKDVEQHYYGMDFGSVDPTVLVEGCVVGKDIYLRKKFHEPVDNPDRVGELIDQAECKSKLIWADSSEASGTIAYLRRKGYKMYAVSKPPGSINFGISLLKNFRINIVDCPEWRREQQMYKWRVVNGIKLDEPVDANNHLWDAARYLAMANLVQSK
jgi:phage terminase large subunit